MPLTIRPKRSCLYVPGSNERALEKAKSVPADVVILDLEDAVIPEAKEKARRLVCDAVGSCIYAPRDAVIRVNGVESPWGEADFAAALAAHPAAILVPKVSSHMDIQHIARLMAKSACANIPAIWAMIETPQAVVNISDIATQAASIGLSTFVMGTNDLAKELNAKMTPDRLAFHYALNATLYAGRAQGIAVIDGVYNDIEDEAGFRHECVQGHIMGFDGKTLIHPRQIAVCNEIFTPTPEEIAHARAVIAAFKEPANAGRGAIKVNGRMTELLHLEQAKHIVALSEAMSEAMSFNLN